MTNRPIRLGMLGGGVGAFIGPIHRIALRMDNQYQLVAGVFSHIESENRDTMAMLGIDPSRCYDTTEALLSAESQRDDGIEAVVIVTPNHLHFPMAKAALEAGLAVICEKPMTLTLAQAQELHAISQAKQAPFLLCHTYSGYPLVHEARARIAAGELGNIHSFSVSYLQEWLTEAPSNDNRQAAWRLNPELAGAAGCLGDIGTHAFQLVSFVLDKPLTGLSARLSSLLPERAVDDNVQASLQLGDVHGQLWASQTAPGHENDLRITVVGDRGSLSWQQEDPNTLWLQPLNAPRQRITRRSEWLSPVAAQLCRTPGGHPEGYLEAFANLYQLFAQKIRGENLAQGTMPDTATGVAGLQFIETAIASSQRHQQWLTVEAVA